VKRVGPPGKRVGKETSCLSRSSWLYINEDGTEVSVVQVHPDADSMEFHMQVASEHFASAFEFLDTTKSVQVYGTPSDALVGQIKQASEPGVSVIVKSELAGFNRLSAMAV
jgi:hypothetical protein